MKKLMFAAVAVFAGGAWATDYTWNGGESGDWRDTTKWSGGNSYPQSGDTATFNTAATVNLSDVDEVDKLVLNARVLFTSADRKQHQLQTKTLSGTGKLALCQTYFYFKPTEATTVSMPMEFVKSENNLETRVLRCCAYDLTFTGAFTGDGTVRLLSDNGGGATSTQAIHLANDQSGFSGTLIYNSVYIDRFMLNAAPVVKLLPSPFLDNLKRERAVMESLDPMNLTWTCRVTAGLDDLGNTNAVLRLGGWERPDVELRGHTLGHWLSGMAVLGGGEGGGGECAAMARDKAAIAVHQLKLCQDAIGTGWVGAFPETDIDKIIAGIRVWAPWYVQHKILQGLIDQYELCGNEEALLVARRFGDWTARKVLSLTPEQATTMRKREFGGIGESLRNLSRMTGEKKYDRAAEVFDDPRVLEPLRAHRDCLNGQHANTFIPKVIAAMRVYENHGDLASRDLAEFFWQTVMAHYLYAPGCVSTKEAFRGPDRQGAHLTGVTGETCCTYNLLKLSRQLFEAEPRAAIAD